ncbi:MAG: FeoB-associated Cys-rich membrane protein [Clostridiales bacterium]|jgi:hypothetical protein|nr:FeoB-associated Cys-rich membrane protein [Clostridiales bacterium]
MESIEIIILIAAIALVAFTVIYNIVKRKKGKTGCGCGCPDCGGSCPSCGHAEEKDGEDGGY